MAAPTLNTLIKPSVTINVDTPVVIGDLVGWDATNLRYTLADADVPTRYAQWVAVADSTASGFYHSVAVSKEAVIYDADAPFTAAAKAYLSSTAGATTQTRPVATSTSRLVQVVGYAIDTFKVYYSLPMGLTEQSDYQPFTQWLASVAFGGTQLDSGNYASEALNADNDDAYLQVSVPDKAVSLAAAYLYFAEEAEAATITLLFSVSSTLHDAQWDAITADTTISAFDVAAAIDPDDIGKTDVTTNFDATDIIRPGALLGVSVNVDLGGTDITMLFGIEFIWNVVP